MFIVFSAVKAAAVSAPLFFDAQLALVEDILAFQEPAAACSCEVERTAGTDDDINCAYRYTCTNDLSGETTASCSAEQAQADITAAACEPE